MATAEGQNAHRPFGPAADDDDDDERDISANGEDATVHGDDDDGNDAEMLR